MDFAKSAFPRRPRPPYRRRSRLVRGCTAAHATWRCPSPGNGHAPFSSPVRHRPGLAVDRVTLMGVGDEDCGSCHAKKIEPLPRLLWRSPYFLGFAEVEARQPLRPRKAPICGNVSALKSHKNDGRYIVCTSTLQLHLAYLCEYDDAVDWYVEQPFSIHYRGRNGAATYTPDMFAMRAQLPVVIDAKSDQKAEDEKWRLRDPYIRTAMTALGFEFEVKTTKDLSRQPRLNNMRRRLDDRRRAVPECVQAIQEHLGQFGPQPLWAVSQATGASLFDLRVLVAHRLIDADIDAEFDDGVILACQP
jgi:hypothetical protein